MQTGDLPQPTGWVEAHRQNIFLQWNPLLLFLWCHIVHELSPPPPAELVDFFVHEEALDFLFFIATCHLPTSTEDLAAVTVLEDLSKCIAKCCSIGEILSRGIPALKGCLLLSVVLHLFVVCYVFGRWSH